MNKLIKSILLTIVISTTGLFAEPPEVVALHFHADYCGSCKVLNPKLEEARAELGNIPLLYVKLDHTDKNTTYQAKLMIEALGLDEIYYAQKKATGYVLLIDVETKTIVGKLTKKDSSEKIEIKIEDSFSG